MKTLAFSLLLCASFLGSLGSARAEETVNLAVPFSPPYVCITNDLSYRVRLYALSYGRRYFIAELTPGEHLSRRMAPPVSGRRWLVTSTGEEELGRFTLTTAADSVVLH